jgi:hypothetical protein
MVGVGRVQGRAAHPVGADNVGASMLALGEGRAVQEIE